MKKNKGKEPAGVIKHTYMELSQGNSLCSYFYLKQAKMSFFFFYKIREQEGRAGPAWGEQCWYRGRGRGVGKGDRRVNMAQILCTHVCKCKNDTC
jgi:hypothetical protein